MIRRWISALIAAFLCAPTAHAENADGAYGRLDGDLAFQGDLGVAILDGGVHGVTSLRALYLSSAGVYARYTEGFDGPTPIARTLGFGVEFRPLFLGRYLQDLERGPAHLDLFADSLSLTLGTWWGAPRSRPFDRTPGFEFGASVELPILPDATGPHVGVGGTLRFTDFQGSRDVVEQGSMILLWLSWHQMIGTGLVVARDMARPN